MLSYNEVVCFEAMTFSLTFCLFVFFHVKRKLLSSYIQAFWFSLSLPVHITQQNTEIFLLYTVTVMYSDKITIVFFLLCVFTAMTISVVSLSVLMWLIVSTLLLLLLDVCCFIDERGAVCLTQALCALQRQRSDYAAFIWWFYTPSSQEGTSWLQCSSCLFQ